MGCRRNNNIILFCFLFPWSPDRGPERNDFVLLQVLCLSKGGLYLHRTRRGKAAQSMGNSAFGFPFMMKPMPSVWDEG